MGKGNRGDAPEDVESDEFVAAFQRVVGSVFRLNGQLLDTAAALTTDLDINTTQWRAIAALRNEPLTVAEIARRIGISRQSARQCVSKLEDRALVGLAPNPRHRRAKLVQLTRKGKDSMHLLNARQARLTKQFTGGLGLTVSALDKLALQLERLRERAEALDHSSAEHG
jgi:DNA-binding MarR family transcriptional regulator